MASSKPLPHFPAGFAQCELCFKVCGLLLFQAWIYRADAQKQAVVAFRGTEQVKWKDFLTDLSVQPKRFNVERTDTILPLPFGSKEELVHKGFLEAYDSIRMKVFNVVDQITKRDEEWTIYVTGHSLGGALATLCAYELATRSCSKELADNKQP